jgi:tetratricopeptide (TPR) repeat protein
VRLFDFYPPVHILIVGGARADRVRRCRQVAASGSPIVRLDDLERAFPDHQVGGTRFVLTQSIYVMQALVDSLPTGARIVATADRAMLERNAPEAFERRGPWRFFELIELSTAPLSNITTDDTEDAGGTFSCSPFAVPPVVPSDVPMLKLLGEAFEITPAEDRLARCRHAVALEPASALAWLALASASREVDDMASARDALDRAMSIAPGWAAAHYEHGKFWLARDDMARARDAFQRAADLMPTFSPAFSNLGATLGELDEPEAALDAFARALAHDPRGFQIINNIGVTTREMGRLDESEAAFRRVLDLEPSFVFGYYNLGHTLFLAGKYVEALAAYEEGRRRDPEGNRRQGCRLAMVRLANGDVDGAERDFWRIANEAPAPEREDLLLEAFEVAQALVNAHPGLAAGQRLVDRLAEALKV